VAVQKIGLEAILNMVNFEKGRKLYSQGIGDMSQKTSNLGKILSGAGKAIVGVGVAAAGLAVGGIAIAAKQLANTIEPASALQESISKVGVVFGENADIMLEWSKSAAAAMGMSRQEALEAAGTYGNLFSALKLDADASADMSRELVQLASDLASFNNLDPTEVLVKLRAGLVGEVEPLRTLGVNLNQATIEAKAFEMGLVKANVDMTKVKVATVALNKAQVKATKALKAGGAESQDYRDALVGIEAAEKRISELMEGKVPELTAAQKAQAAYALIMEQTALAQGDFERTSEGLANQQRILRARLTDIKATIGTAVLPVMERLTGTLITGLSGPQMEAAIQKITNWLSTKLPEAIETAQKWVSEEFLPAFRRLRDGLAEGWDEAKRKILEWWDGTADVRARIKGWYETFRDEILPAWTEKIREAWDEAKAKVLSWWTDTQGARDNIKAWFENFRDQTLPEWQSRFLEALETTKTEIASFAEGAASSLAGIEGEFAKWTFEILPEFQRAIENAKLAIQEFAQLGMVLSPFALALDSIGKSAGGVSKKLGEVVGLLMRAGLRVQLDIITGATKAFADAMDWLARAMGTVYDWLGKLVDRLPKLKLPTDFKPGSPTPFEIGLQGINQELKKMVTVHLAGLGPDASATRSMPAMTQARTLAGATATTHNIGGDTIVQNISDPVSFYLAQAIVQDRKRDRWNAAMGVA
jgi:hypothetical protein